MMRETGEIDEDDEEALNKIQNKIKEKEDNIRKSLDQAEKDVGTTQKLKLKTKRYFRFSIRKMNRNK